MKLVSTYLKGNLTDYEYDRTDYRVKYDLDNRIVEVKADSETIRYRYDALGRRIISKGDDETVLIWWGDSECAEYEHRASKDAIQNDIMGHPTRLNSVIARDTEDRENRIELQWYHKNYLDHVYAVSDDNGNLVEHYRYTAFGEPEIYSATGARRNTSAIGNTVMWNTRRYDADNGLYYYKYRHYAANIGRWLGRDPVEEDGGINLYGFVGNNSINQFDLLGLTNCRYPVGSTSPLGGVVFACVGTKKNPDTCSTDKYEDDEKDDEEDHKVKPQDCISLQMVKKKVTKPNWYTENTTYPEIAKGAVLPIEKSNVIAVGPGRDSAWIGYKVKGTQGCKALHKKIKDDGDRISVVIKYDDGNIVRETLIGGNNKIVWLPRRQVRNSEKYHKKLKKVDIDLLYQGDKIDSGTWKYKNL